jgi:hypothetical protein
MQAIMEENLIHAYDATQCCVEDDTPFNLTVGEVYVALHACH